MEYNAEDIDELITYYIRSRPELWDCKNKSYRDNELKKKLWCEMAEKLNVTDEFIKERWKNLRDRYIKEKAKSVKKNGQAAIQFSSWPLMASLEFLADTVESCNMTPHKEVCSPLNTLFPSDSTSPCGSVSSRSSTSNQSPPAKRAKRQVSKTYRVAINQAILNYMEKRALTNTISADNLFYLSISKASQQLCLSSRLRLKTLILQIFSQVVAEQQIKS